MMPYQQQQHALSHFSLIVPRHGNARGGNQLMPVSLRDLRQVFQTESPTRIMYDRVSLRDIFDMKFDANRYVIDAAKRMFRNLGSPMSPSNARVPPALLRGLPDPRMGYSVNGDQFVVTYSHGAPMSRILAVYFAVDGNVLTSHRLLEPDIIDVTTSTGSAASTSTAPVSNVHKDPRFVWIRMY
jgi:hypothetical protein